MWEKGLPVEDSPEPADCEVLNSALSEIVKRVNARADKRLCRKDLQDVHEAIYQGLDQDEL